MIRAEAVVARLLVFAMQLPYLTKATDCVSGIYYTAVPEPSLFETFCNPYLGPMSLHCRVQTQANVTETIDMNWFYAEGGVPQNSIEPCPSVDGVMGLQIVNDTRHTVVKHWDPIKRSLSVNLTVQNLSEQDIGRYWCQASVPHQILSRTQTAYCVRAESQTAPLNFPCTKLHKEVMDCVDQMSVSTPQTTPAHSSTHPSSTLLTPISITLLPSISSMISSQPSSVPSLVPSTASASVDIKLYSNSNSILYSTIAPVTSLLSTIIPSSPYRYLELPTSPPLHTTSSPPSSPTSAQMSGGDDGGPSTVLIASIAFCTLSAFILLITTVVALSVMRYHRRMHRWIPEWHVNEGAGTSYSLRQRSNNAVTFVATKTMDSSASSAPGQLRIHQEPQNPLQSTLQNVSISLGPGPNAPSSLSVGSGIYSEIDPLSIESRDNAMQRDQPPLPPRLQLPTREDNLYDVPEDDASSTLSHTYTLPCDARDEAMINTSSVFSDWQHGTDTGDSWFGRSSPILIHQNQCTNHNDDVLEVVPAGINRRLSWQSQATFTSQEAVTEEESSTRSISPTHERLEVYLPPERGYAPAHSQAAEHAVRSTNGSISSEFSLDFRELPSVLMDSGQRTLESRSPYPGPSYQANPLPQQSFSHTNRLPVRNEGTGSPVLSTSSSGCTDLSKYSGDYERDPLYMERLVRQRATCLLAANSNGELSSGVESASSPAPPRKANEHHYAALNCNNLDPKSDYARLQRHTALESEV